MVTHYAIGTLNGNPLIAIEFDHKEWRHYDSANRMDLVQMKRDLQEAGVDIPDKAVDIGKFLNEAVSANG